jgi:hypothetical protein
VWVVWVLDLDGCGRELFLSYVVASAWSGPLSVTILGIDLYAAFAQ